MKWKGLKENHTKKASMSKLKTKNLVITFLDIYGIILKYCEPRGQTVNVVYCTEVLKQLQPAIAAKRSESWKANNWLLRRNNAPAHCLVRTLKFFAHNRTTILKQMIYSPDLAPNDFFLYPKIKEVLSGAHFAGEEVMRKACERVLKHVPEEAFRSVLIHGKFKWGSV